MAYEIFISYKCSDEEGNRTRDFAIAQELYLALTDMGYSTFFSSNTLEQIGSSRYKADIDSALDETKLMIVVLSKAEYASSHWVQYEWDSFYNDYLSGFRSEANLFTLTVNLDIKDLPRTLRNVQNFDYKDGLAHVCECVKNAIPKKAEVERASESKTTKEKRISIITGKQVTAEDIAQAAYLDRLVYDDIYLVTIDQCAEWIAANPDIYILAKDVHTDRYIAYANLMPVTDECYERIKKGDFIDTGITADMILSYDMPFPYSLYFSSIVVHPEYQNTEVFMEMFNAIVDKFVTLGEHEVFIRRMIADAVTPNGEKFCKLFGMKKLKGSDHDSSLYEITMIPPKFRILSKKTKVLFDYYQRKYTDAPYLFTETSDSDSE